MFTYALAPYAYGLFVVYLHCMCLNQVLEGGQHARSAHRGVSREKNGPLVHIPHGLIGKVFVQNHAKAL